jgi:tripartite-type tricarboxylate transporter receptor subunit TctC
MKTFALNRNAGACALALTALVPLASAAQTWPTKPIRFVQPSAAGVQLDVGMRAILAKFKEKFGWDTVVDNRPGGQFVPSTTAVTQAEPDGHTVLNLVQSVTIVPVARRDAPFDLNRDLAHVTLVGGLPLALVVHPSIPVRTLAELVAYSKANAGKVNYAIPGGTGTSTHLSGEYLKLVSGLDMTAVSYKDTSTVFPDLYENRVQVAISSLGNWVEAFKAGKVRGIAVTGKRREALAPELPTLIEMTGNPDLDLDSWAGWSVPARTPRAVIDRLHRAYVEVLQLPELRESLVKVGITPTAETPEEFTRRVVDSQRRWERTVREAKLTLN